MVRFGKFGSDEGALGQRKGVAFGKRVDGPSGHRRNSRKPVAIRAEMVTKGSAVDVTLIDLSNTGARLHGTSLPSVGDQVLIRVGPMEASGTLSWIEGDICGVHFATPTANDDDSQLST